MCDGPPGTAAELDSHNDAIFRQYQYPVAHRLSSRCDAIFRIPGESRGADIEMVKAGEMGLRVFTHIDEVPRRVTTRP